ncbi:MAG TPA: DUF5994 family protein [Mycobacteriales bacterium]|nr:DUF5994 family protein [Mycobacteriales bacterium]
MTTVQEGRPADAQERGATAHPIDARFAFRQPVSSAGFVDAAWWPYTRELVNELASLLDTLWSSARDITRVTYNLDAWDAAPRRIRVNDRTVRLGGFRTSAPCMIRMSDAWGRERIDILVIPPATDPHVAERALRLAAAADSAWTGDQLLAMAARSDGPDVVRSR